MRIHVILLLIFVLFCWEIAPIQKNWTMGVAHSTIHYKDKFASYHIVTKTSHIQEKAIFSCPKDTLLKISLTTPLQHNTIFLKIPLLNNEKWYGTGEQFSNWELPITSKKFIPLWVEEQGIGRGDLPTSFAMKVMGIKGESYSTYYPIPVWISSFGRKISLPNSWETAQISYSIYQEHQQHFLEIRAVGTQLTVNIQHFEQPKKLFTPPNFASPLPDWSRGSILGLQGGKSRVDSIARVAVAAGSPVTGIWIQDWVGKRQVDFGSRLWWKWETDTLQYPELKMWSDSLWQNKIALLGYMNSFLADKSPVCEEAMQKGFLVKNQQGKPYKIDAGGFDAYLVDLFHPEAFEWMKELIKKRLIAQGFRGWMADFAEWLPPDAVVYPNISGEKCHNLYAEAWTKVNQAAISEAQNSSELLFFQRSGFGDSRHYNILFWAGDQTPDFGQNDGLASYVHALNSASLSGIPILHSDIGGYTSLKYPIIRTYRDNEVFHRWCEVNVFTPFFRTHEGLTPQQNYQFYTDTLSQRIFAKYGKWHLKLAPYFDSLEKELLEKGIPPNRPLLLEYPKDPVTWNISEEFLLGEELLIAPVLAAHQNTIICYLPEGEWVHLFTKKTYKGKQFLKLNAPIGTPAVFYQKSRKWADFFQQNF